jgi:3'-5' exoribonuclease 1
MKTFVIFDLEATCDNTDPNWINEVIEIGAVKINQNGNIISEFSKFAKPQFDTILTEFCTELTSITQDDIDNAEYLDKVLIEFNEWSKGSILLSWGGYDIRQLKRDIESQKVDIDWIEMKNRHIDFKRWYSNKNKLRKPCGMSKALKLEKLPLDGTHHRGIDDARNISKIFLNYINEFIK